MSKIVAGLQELPCLCNLPLLLSPMGHHILQVSGGRFPGCKSFQQFPWPARLSSSTPVT